MHLWMSGLGATCDTPVGACAERVGETLAVHTFVGLPDGSSFVRDRMEGNPEDPSGLGSAAAVRLESMGVRELLVAAETA